MDLAEGLILSQYYKAQRDARLPEPEAARIFSQIVEAVGYLHKNGIFHRDLKTENVMIDSGKKIKIIDFGFSVKAEPMQRLNLFCGTPNYMSPEIILKKDYYGGPSDIWALGVLLYVICAGHFPFKGNYQFTKERTTRNCTKRSSEWS
jgi:serine/threonine protein kinase